MGFLRLFKKKGEEKHIDDNLDTPPKPPSASEHPHKDLPKFEFKPELHESPKKAPVDEKPPESLPELHKKPEIHHEPALTELHKKPEMHQEPIFPTEEGHEFIPKPPIEESHLEIPPIKKTEPKPIVEHEEPHQESEPISRPFLKQVGKSKIKGLTYIKLDQFKYAINNIVVLRDDLKKSDQFLLNLSKQNSNKEFERLYNTTKDIQEKLMFIEKNLFKGD